ncbi:Heptaketide hydrolyase ayg1 [Ceratocystis fimbriata CBS 114723]|uniref:Heptaketide hydrolyase ayg1 n=1 Tax=Ceratocystis fimbriata CBS 114723 TaxID=1035309 RepID=A0A2C5WXY5_9PEZI|nr:Heptaketide hydrolyase ayg1 [Ceratocystis fimbriata CBS 114723]
MKNWMMGKDAFEETAPHHEGMKALWETKWKLVCQRSVYPFQEGKYEDFEPIFQHLIENNINDGYSAEYSLAFVPTAERLDREAEALLETDPAAANKLWLRASAVLRVARLPYFAAYPEPSCPVKLKIFEMQKSIFLKAGSRWECPVQDLMIPHVYAAGNDWKEIPAYVRTPTNAATQPAPTIILMTGLDGYRCDNSVRCDRFLDRGWASVVVEVPGTGDCPADSADPDSPDRLWTSLLAWMKADGRFDMSKIMVWGGSAGGYYAIRIAHTHKDQLIGVVAQGAGCHYFYDPEWLSKADDHEYPFKLSPAMVRKHGFSSVEEYVNNVQKRFSLLETGILHKESTRLLLVNGTKDGLVPIEDATMLFEYGSPKEARLITDAIHMGYPAANKVVLPWLEDVMAKEIINSV